MLESDRKYSKNHLSPGIARSNFSLGSFQSYGILSGGLHFTMDGHTGQLTNNQVTFFNLYETPPELLSGLTRSTAPGFQHVSPQLVCAHLCLAEIEFHFLPSHPSPLKSDADAIIPSQCVQLEALSPRSCCWLRGVILRNRFFCYHSSEGAKSLKGPARVEPCEPFSLG